MQVDEGRVERCINGRCSHCGLSIRLSRAVESHRLVVVITMILKLSAVKYADRVESSLTTSTKVRSAE